MEHLFTVAGHTFKLLLPERYLAAEWLALSGRTVG